MNKDPNCTVNGHGINDKGVCIYCSQTQDEIGKTEAWRDAADRLLDALARENKYIVSDMVIVFLESAGYGLADYSPLGGTFKRAAKRGVIKRIDRPTKQALWASCIYKPEKASDHVPILRQGQIIGFKDFGELDHVTYRIAEVVGNTIKLEPHED